MGENRRDHDGSFPSQVGMDAATMREEKPVYARSVRFFVHMDKMSARI
jgi:hypothetical protein